MHLFLAIIVSTTLSYKQLTTYSNYTHYCWENFTSTATDSAVMVMVIVFIFKMSAMTKKLLDTYLSVSACAMGGGGGRTATAMRRKFKPRVEGSIRGVLRKHLLVYIGLAAECVRVCLD